MKRCILFLFLFFAIISANAQFSRIYTDNNGVLHWASNQEIEDSVISWINPLLPVLTDYAYLPGRAGGQILNGGTNPSDDLILKATSAVGAPGSEIQLITGQRGLTILNNGNVGVGLTTNPSASLHVYGGIRLGNDGSNNIFFFPIATNAVSSVDPLGRGVGFYNYYTSQATNNVHFSYTGESVFPSAGIHEMVRYSRNFVPSSGTATFDYINIRGTVNQTGGANGIVNGINIANSIAASASYRAINISTAGQYGIYQSSSTPLNYLNGNVGIKTPTPVEALEVVGKTKSTNLQATALVSASYLITDASGNLAAGSGDILTTTDTIVTATTYTTGTPTFILADDDTAGAQITITLSGTDKVYYIKKIGSTANVVIDGNGDNIDGAATATLTTQYQALTVKRVGSDWYVF